MALGPRSRGGERRGLEVVAVVGSLVLSRVAGPTLTTPPSSCVPRRNLCGPEEDRRSGTSLLFRAGACPRRWAIPVSRCSLHHSTRRDCRVGDDRPKGQVNLPKLLDRSCLRLVEGALGLEPRRSGVKARRVYPFRQAPEWSALRDLNPRVSGWKPDALPGLAKGACRWCRREESNP